MTDIKKILEEIYNIDPSLKAREEEIIKLIGVLAGLRPEAGVDENFVTSLRARLETEARNQVMENTQPSPVNNFNWSMFTNLAGATLVLVLVLGASYFYLAPSGPGQEDLGGTTIAENDDGTVLVETDNGVVIVDTSEGSGKPEGGPKIVSGFVKFASDAEYKEYLAEAEKISGTGVGFGGGMRIANPIMAVEDAAMGAPVPSMAPMAQGTASNESRTEPGRVSETNVQVAGIDEPDILKTDGKEIYFSPSSFYYPWGIPTPGIRPMMMEGGAGVSAPAVETTMVAPDSSMPIYIPPEYISPKTVLVKAFPASALAKDSAVDKTGNLLISGKTLVIFGNQEITGFDVSDPKKPAEKWNIKLDSRNAVTEARLMNGTIYLITQTQANRYEPCPIPLFETKGGKIIVPCMGIYHPTRPVQANVNYHISTIDPASGKVSEKISFVGSYGSTIYMSPNAIYVAYAYDTDMVDFFLGFFRENKDIVPQSIIDRLTKLAGYDISSSSKMNEFETILQDFQMSLDDDARLKLENEMENRAKDYMDKHKRELQKTDIVRIAVSDLSVKSLGTISGSLLNQFSLDEYNGNLRAATTVGGGWSRFGRSGESENDIYVLDGNLSIIGKIQGLGLDERIYSARFIQDKGYLVTFKQIDPFFVLDLSDPKNPRVRGELKIPGYSSYLHPITKDLIIGVGMDGSKVKVSLFDTSDPANPKEASKYSLNEYWTEVTNTHHAFLLDEKHKVFFMPGSQGGYVLSYADMELSLRKAVSGISAKRAVYIDDFLYIAGDDKIIVLNENTWERAGELKLR